MTQLSDQLLAYLKGWHTTTVQTKTAAGFEVNLTLAEFIGLFKPSHLATLQKAIDANRLRYLQRHDNPYALVATWRSYAACSSGIYNKDTATICSRMKSAKINLPAPGDTLRSSHRAKIGEAKRGVPQTPEHRKALSETLRGRPKAPWTEERKAARRAAIAAKKEKTND